MSYNRKIIQGEDFKRTLVYKVGKVATSLLGFTNYAVALVYKDSDDIPSGGSREIVRMSRNSVADSTHTYETWLTDNDEANGKCYMNLHASVTSAMTEGAKIDAIFFTQVNDADFDDGLLQPAFKFPLGTVVSGVAITDLAS